MTQPGFDPTERFLERMRLVSQQEYGTKYRPGLANILASSDASPDDLIRIGAMVRAMDTQRRVRLLSMSGAQEATSGEDGDLLDVTGAGAEKVQAANYHAKASADEDHSWWMNIYDWFNHDLFGDNDSSQDDTIRAATGPIAPGFTATLDALAKAPGFLYRSAAPSLGFNSGVMGGIDTPVLPIGEKGNPLGDAVQHAKDMTAAGYGTSAWDSVAFNWNQGESTFRDLDPTRARYGDEDVDLALEVYRTGWQSGDTLHAFRVNLENQYAEQFNAGDTKGAEATLAKIKRIEDEDFVKGAYEAVNRKHISIGRDLASVILPEDQEDSAAFSAISGTADTLWTLFADPTILGGKVAKTVQLQRWGLDAIDSAKIRKMLGEADENGVVPTGVYAPANNSRRIGVERFLDRAKQYRAAMAEGRVDDAAVIYAGAQKAHRDLMPLWSEVNGVRPAVTKAEREAAEKSGLRHIDANGVENAYGGVKVDPIETVGQFADFAASHWSLMRMTNGLPAHARPLMPGKMGFAAEKRAQIKMNRIRKGLDGAKARAAEAGDEAAVFDFSNVKELDKIIGSEAEELFAKAAVARGQQLFEEANGLRGRAVQMRAKAEAASRRLSTLLPGTRELRLHSAADAADVRRFARMYLPKAEAERFAAMWEHGSPATRRTLGKALLIQTFEAAGLSRSVIGREFMEQYSNDIVELNKRRYGFLDSDVIKDEYAGPRRAGMYQNQMEDSIVLPSFTELKRIAAKAAVLGYDPALGGLAADAGALAKAGDLAKRGALGLRYSLFSSTVADRFMQLVKLGWITTGSNMARNALDEYGLLTLTGNRKMLVRGRQTMRDAGLDNEFKQQTRRFVAITNHKIPKALRGKIRNLRDATTAINQGKLEAMGRNAAWRVEYAKELHETTVADELAEYLGGRIIDNPDEVTTLGHEFARAAAEAGVPVERFRYTGHEMVEQDGGAGYASLASMYGQRFAGAESPAHGVLAFLMWHHGVKNPEFWESLDPKAIDRMRHLLFPDSESGLMSHAEPPKVEDLVAYLKQDKFAELRQLSEHFNVDEAGKRIRPDDTDALDAAIARMVPNYIADVLSSVVGKNRKINPDLASRLLNGDIPDVNELKALGLDALPTHVVKAQYAAAPASKGSIFVEGTTALMTRFYDGIVTKPMRALIRTPLYVDAYTTSRAYTSKYADMLVEKHGWARDLADAQARKISEKQALNEVIKYVDNPKVASQFSAMNRNWWSFFRAQEDWLRRWGRAMKADPVMIRKAHLGIIGANEAGLLDRDADGNMILTYPGSGAITEGFLRLGGFIGWNNPALIPSVPDLHTRLTFLNPSLTNPFAYSSTPLVSLPMRMLTTLAPGGELMDKAIDRQVNGELGAGRDFWEQVLPSPLLRIVQLMDDKDDVGSVVGGATATAMVNLALNGQLEQYADTPDSRADAIADIQTAAYNALAVRMVFGFFAPGAPGMPELGEDADAAQADLSYADAGINSLNDEFKQMVARLGPGPAYALWTELHPEALVFIDAGKTETAPGAHTTTTLGAARFVMDNKEFFTGKYSSIAPYFMPEAPGKFDQVAWNTLTELGVRQYKDVSDLFVDLATANGVSLYFKDKDKSDAAIAEARKAGDKNAVDELTAKWADRKAELNVRYPTLDDYFSEGTARALRRQDAVDTLEALVTDADAPAQIQPQLAGITRMVQTYRGYQTLNEQLKGQRSVQAKARRQELKVSFHDSMQKIIKEYPTLEDAYNGIFRSLVETE